ncbi:MAG TPA: hypothetical protein VGC09_06565, partial [Rhodopila sp.]
MKKICAFVAALMICSHAGAVPTVPINSPVPSNAYITFDGLNWAWGNPCSFQSGCGDATLVYQG